MQLFSLHLLPTWCQEHGAVECFRSVGNHQLWWRETAGELPLRRTEVVGNAARVKEQMQTTDLLWGKLLRDTPVLVWEAAPSPALGSDLFLFYFGCFHTFTGMLPAFLASTEAAVSRGTSTQHHPCFDVL